MSESRMLNLGRAGEHLVMADLLSRGFSCCMSDAEMSYDILLEHAGTFVKLQVKATQKPGLMNKEYATSAYLFNARRAGKGGKRMYDIGEFEGYALVALDTKQIAYLPFTEKLCRTIILRDRRQTYRMNAGKVAPFIDEFGIDKFLQVVRAAQ